MSSKALLIATATLLALSAVSCGKDDTESSVSISLSDQVTSTKEPLLNLQLLQLLKPQQTQQAVLLQLLLLPHLTLLKIQKLPLQQSFLLKVLRQKKLHNRNNPNSRKIMKLHLKHLPLKIRHQKLQNLLQKLRQKHHRLNRLSLKWKTFSAMLLE